MHTMIGNKEKLSVGNSRRCHVIVGGGSSGIILCNQLLEKDDVILVERGSKDPYSSSHSTQVPSLFPQAAVYSGEGTRACTMPQEALGHRLVLYPQGSGIGGTSNVNAMIWSAGHPAVFDNFWHRKWNSEALNSSFELVRNTLNPKKILSPLLGQLANNSRCGNFEDDLLNNEGVESTYKNQLVWDSKPIKTEYLATVGNDNKRANIGNLLSENRTNTNNQETDVTDDIKQSYGGKLTVLEYCTTESIVFESVSDTTGSAPSTALLSDKGDQLTPSKSECSDDFKAPKDFDKNAKLTAVAVKCYNSKDKTSGTFLVKPSGGGEIIICAGAFESPRILLSSGLGNIENSKSAVSKSADSSQSRAVVKEENKDDTSCVTLSTDSTPLQSKVEADDEQHQQPQSAFPSCPVYLPGIGRNLQDHTALPIMCTGKWWGHERALTELKERLRKNVLEERSGSLIYDALRKEEVGQSKPISSLSSTSSSSLLGVLAVTGALGVIIIAGMLHQISSTESWNDVLRRTLKGIPSSLLSLTTIQLSSLIIMIIFLSMVVLHMWVNNKNKNKSSQIKVEVKGEGEGGYVHPLNCVHGYVNLDAAGNLLDKDSKQPPSAQLLLVDGSLCPECLLPEMLLPRYALTKSSSLCCFYMMYVRSALVFCLKGILTLPFLRVGASCSFGFLVCCVQPHSRGRLHPDTDTSGRTKDLSAPLLIEHGLLSDKRDLIVMMNAMKTARKLLLGRPLNESLPATPTTPHTTHTQSTPSTATTANKSNKSEEDINKVQKVPLHCFEALPGMFFGNTEEEDAFTYYAKCITTTYFHASGTCAMETGRYANGNTDASTSTSTSTGSTLDDSTSVYNDCDDNMAVVDVELRVRGVSKLRVCDASVFPRIPSGPTSATCMAVAVSLAKLLLES